MQPQASADKVANIFDGHNSSAQGDDSSVVNRLSPAMTCSTGVALFSVLFDPESGIDHQVG